MRLGERKVLFPINGHPTFIEFLYLFWCFGSFAPTCGRHLLCVSDFVDKLQKYDIVAALNARRWTRALTRSDGPWEVVCVCGGGMPVPLFTQLAQDGDS